MGRGSMEMKKYKVAVTSYGFAIVEAPNEEGAIEIAKSLKREDYDWTDLFDQEVREALEHECASPSYRVVTEKDLQKMKVWDNLFVKEGNEMHPCQILEKIPFSDEYEVFYPERKDSEIVKRDQLFLECPKNYDPAYQMEER